MPTDLPTYLPACLPAYLPAYLPTYLPTSPAAYLPKHIYAYTCVNKIDMLADTCAVVYM